ncbi:hypothetical protein ACKFKG_06030 [Phormidesmis sp. 146-35]
MTTSNRLNQLRQLFASDSTSWGSLAVLAIGVALLVSLMVAYAYGWSL